MAESIKGISGSAQASSDNHGGVPAVDQARPTEEAAFEVGIVRTRIEELMQQRAMRKNRTWP